MKGVGINPYSQPHYLDHLAIVCILQDVPLLIVDDSLEQLARQCYPGLNILKLEYGEFSPEYLIANFDYFISSDLWDRNILKQKFSALENAYGKPMRSVHCPHGFSDKGFYLKKSVDEDVLLYYGEHMLELFKREGVYDRIHQIVRSGNYRATYYNQNKAYLDNIAEAEVFSKFGKKQTTILYAPTWVDLEQTSSYFDAAEALFSSLPDEYNLVVKLHPRLELDDTPRYYQLLGKYESKKNIVFIKDLPLIYPLLAGSDIYLGDVSSVGYDFLTFDRPMYFLNPKKFDYYLFRCGEVISPEEYTTVFERIKRTVEEDQGKYQKIRKEAYDYTFGKERKFEDIKDEVDKCLSLT